MLLTCVFTVFSESDELARDLACSPCPRPISAQHLALARGQRVGSAELARRSRAPTPRRAASSAAAVDGADRLDQLLRLDVLEQVAGGAGAHGAGNTLSSSTKLVSTITRAVGPRGAHPPDRLDAVDARHHEIDQHDVGREPLGRRPAPPRRRPPRRRPRCRPAGRGTSAAPGARPRGRRRPARGSLAAPRAVTVVPSPGRDDDRERRRRAPARAPPSTSARAAASARRAPAGSKPTPSSATVSASRAVARLAAAARSRSALGVPERVVERLLGDPEHLAPRPPARQRARAVDRAARCRARGTRRSTSTCLRSVAARPSSSSVGRAQLEDQRAQLRERLVRAARRAAAICAAAPRRVAVEQRGGRLRGQHAALNSVWLTESCSSRASRLRSSTTVSSRLRS